MKIVEFKVQNFKAFDGFHVRESGWRDFNVLAGENGTGKTSLLEASEMVLNPHFHSTFQPPEQLIRDKSKPTEFMIKIRFDEDERGYLQERVNEISADLHSGVRSEEIPSVVTSTLKLKYSSAQNRVQPESDFFTPGLEFLFRRGYRFSLFLSAYRRVEFPRQQLFSGLAGDEVPQRLQPEFTAEMGLRMHRINPLREINRVILRSMAKRFGPDELYKDVREYMEMLDKLIAPKKLLKPNIDEGGVIDFKIDDGRGTKHPLSALSSGELELLGIGALLILAKRLWGYKPIILIDEPELHMHPLFVERFSVLLQDLFLKSEESAGTFVVATHSEDFIDNFPENIFKIEGGTVHKVSGLEQRKELLNALGKKVGPNQLVENIVFVEGEIPSQLPDQEIYQRLIDPHVKKSYFMSVGSYSSAETRERWASRLFEYLSTKGSELKCFALVDGDRASQPDIEGNAAAVVLPAKQIENLFLVPEKLSGGAKSVLSIDIDAEEVKRMLLEAAGNPDESDGRWVLNVPGKDVLDTFFSRLGEEKGISITKKMKTLIKKKTLELMDYSDLHEEVRRALSRFRRS